MTQKAEELETETMLLEYLASATQARYLSPIFIFYFFLESNPWPADILKLGHFEIPLHT